MLREAFLDDPELVKGWEVLVDAELPGVQKLNYGVADLQSVARLADNSNLDNLGLDSDKLGDVFKANSNAKTGALGVRELT